MNKLVYIILVNYNSMEHTKECVDSLHNINYLNYKIVVVDNASKDDDLDGFEKKYEDVILIRNKENIGFAGANNIGIEYALNNNADYILMLNNDTIVEKNFLDVLVDKSEKSNEIGICTGRINYYYDKKQIWYAGGYVNKFKGNTQVCGLNENEDTYEDIEKYYEFASGCCMLLKVSALKKVGYMNEDYFLYYEDADYSMKYLKNGFKILYSPQSIIYHKESVTTNKYSYNYQYYFARNRLLFIKRNLDLRNKVTAYPITLLWLAYKIIKGEFNILPCLDGVKDFILRKFNKRRG